MARKVLKNKPLVEAIFEIRWLLKKKNPNIAIYSQSDIEYDINFDPHYKLLVGRLYDKLINEYPYYEVLPASNMPDEISAYIVQHRFRKAENEWPLIQLGPGILTVNDTKGYIWEDFEQRILQALNTLFDLYPKSEEGLIINGLMLRYIDAIDFDYEKNYIFDFLKQNLKTHIKLYQKLFENTEVEKIPIHFDLKFDFKTLNPKGIIFLRFGKGRNKLKNIDAFIMETVVQSDIEEIPQTQNDISNWVQKAHNLADDWFFKLIEGELEKRFE